MSGRPLATSSMVFHVWPALPPSWRKLNQPVKERRKFYFCLTKVKSFWSWLRICVESRVLAPKKGRGMKDKVHFMSACMIWKRRVLSSWTIPAPTSADPSPRIGHIPRNVWAQLFFSLISVEKHHIWPSSPGKWRIAQGNKRVRVFEKKKNRKKAKHEDVWTHANSLDGTCNLHGLHTQVLGYFCAAFAARVQHFIFLASYSKPLHLRFLLSLLWTLLRSHVDVNSSSWQSLQSWTEQILLSHQSSARFALFQTWPQTF